MSHLLAEKPNLSTLKSTWWGGSDSCGFGVATSSGSFGFNPDDKRGEHIVRFWSAMLSEETRSAQDEEKAVRRFFAQTVQRMPETGYPA